MCTSDRSWPIYGRMGEWAVFDPKHRSHANKNRPSVGSLGPGRGRSADEVTSSYDLID